MIHLAQAGIYRAKWTEDIHQEWMRNLKKRYPSRRDQGGRTGNRHLHH
ncbi:MAG: hypothetical protein QOH31_1660 [Verrucomicrobiota bacterium]